MRRPSRASVAAIGINYVLNSAPPALRMLGLDAVASMACDWSVAILEQAVTAQRAGPRVRRHALLKLRELLEEAMAHGYRHLSPQALESLMARAQPILNGDVPLRQTTAAQAVEDICNHASQAVEQGCFGRLSDF